MSILIFIIVSVFIIICYNIFTHFEKNIQSDVKKFVMKFLLLFSTWIYYLVVLYMCKDLCDKNSKFFYIYYIFMQIVFIIFTLGSLLYFLKTVFKWELTKYEEIFSKCIPFNVILKPLKFGGAIIISFLGLLIFTSTIQDFLNFDNKGLNLLSHVGRYFVYQYGILKFVSHIIEKIFGKNNIYEYAQSFTLFSLLLIYMLGLYMDSTGIGFKGIVIFLSLDAAYKEYKSISMRREHITLLEELKRKSKVQEDDGR